jgi:hypothetical protein
MPRIKFQTLILYPIGQKGKGYLLTKQWVNPKKDLILITYEHYERVAG